MPTPNTTGGSPPKVVPPSDEEISENTPASVQRKPELRKYNSHCLSLWGKQMQAMDLKRRYKKVSINRLRHVFETRYKYEVHEMLLGQDKKGRPTQAFINKELSNFVYEQDEEQMLLIVYGAGHGIPENKTGQLILVSECVLDAASRAFNSIVWNQAEMLVRSIAHADMFLILDCCHAGRLLHARNKLPRTDRIFEFLGACGLDQTTPLPGEHSFTSALIWALEQFAEEGTSFLSAERREKIIEYKHMSPKQDPCLSPRGFQSFRKLILEPLSGSKEETNITPGQISESSREGQEVTDVKYGLNLQFLLPEMPNDDEVRRLSESLKHLIISGKISSKQVLWKGLIFLEESKRATREMVRDVVNAWQNQVRRRKRSSTSNPCSNVLGESLRRELLSVKTFESGVVTPGTSESTSDAADLIGLNLKDNKGPSPYITVASANLAPQEPDTFYIAS